MKETSVSLLVMTGIPHILGGSQEIAAVLQERGKFNWETFRHESWPGAAQLTVHGKVEPGEAIDDALLREIKQELGNTFVGMVSALEFTTAHLVEIGRVDKPNKDIVHYAIWLPSTLVAASQIHPSCGGLFPIWREDLPNIRNLAGSLFSKAEGVVSRKEIAMFPDEIDALKRAFEIFGKQPLSMEIGFNGDELHRLKCMHRLGTES